MKEKKIKKPGKIGLCFVSVLLVIVIGLNALFINVVSPLYPFFQNFLNEQPDNEETRAKSQAAADITQEVEAEGLVLLTNNGVLPLEENAKVNVFGNGSIHSTYGGTGSGAGDSSNSVTFYQGLKNADIAVNEELENFTKENAIEREEVFMIGNDFSIHEIPVSQYSQELINKAKEYSETAIVVYSRSGGEGDDFPLSMEPYGGSVDKHYLELQEDELALLDMVRNNFENVIVVMNAPNAMELGFLEQENVDAAIWAGCVGSTGFNAVGETIAGIINPSGRTADIFAYEVESAPSYYNFGDYDYSNITYANASMFAGTGSADAGQDNYHYVEYVEGIYVGYRYYETAAADGFIDYEEIVQFPFGYGLSYTEFSKEIVEFKADGRSISVTVKVSNTGDVPGKDVVEVYYSAPYIKGGIEKSHVVLVGFDKTEVIQPGESEDVTITFAYEDMASYDYSEIKAEGGAYVLEAGAYQILVQNDSHNVVDSRVVVVERDYIYNEENDGARESDGIIAKNQFNDVSFGTDLTYVSRADWAGTMPTERAPRAKEATQEQIDCLTIGTVFEKNEVEDIVFAQHGLSLADMKGLDYDDPKWSELLEQISVDEMKILIGNGGWCTMAVDSINKPFMTECDGPNGINNLMANMLSGIKGNQFTGQSVLGMTWNTELAQQMGRILGEEAIAYGITGLYAPAMNIHRSPFSGRNYEYYSEDGFLSGKIAAAEIQGIQSTGVYCYSKHYAVNDQESNREAGGLITWANEQSMREIYLRGFELAVKEGKTQGIMSSYNRIGLIPTAESYPLLTTVLRNEWGFVGCVITDCVMACTTQDVNRALYAGNDLQLTIMGNALINDETAGTPSGRQAMRQATKNILYVVANSAALDNTEGGMTTLEIVLIVVDIVIFALFILYFVRRYQKMKRWKEYNELVIKK